MIHAYHVDTRHRLRVMPCASREKAQVWIKSQGAGTGRILTEDQTREEIAKRERAQRTFDWSNHAS